MGKEFDEKHEQAFMDFMEGLTDDFDMWACDPADLAWAGELVEGLSIDSAGGACPFQVEGSIAALAADGTTVPMRFYYRSRHGTASLKVAMVQDECYGPDPLFSSSLKEVDEFDYSRWVHNLVRMVEDLAPVKFLYRFPTLAVDEETRQLPPKVQALVDEGMSVEAIIECGAAAKRPMKPQTTLELFQGVEPEPAEMTPEQREDHEMALAYFGTEAPRVAGSDLLGRGDTPEEALADALTFRPSHWLIAQGITEHEQRTRHEDLTRHHSDTPIELDQRKRPDRELAEQPFVLKNVRPDGEDHLVVTTEEGTFRVHHEDADPEDRRYAYRLAALVFGNTEAPNPEEKS